MEATQDPNAAIRAKLIADITRGVTELIEKDEFDDLHSIMESTGYLDNRVNTDTSAKMGASVLAVCGITDLTWLYSCAALTAACVLTRRGESREVANRASQRILDSEVRR